MDRHKYVKVAYHGFKEMSKEDKVGTYGNTLIQDTFDEPDYALIDTLFSLAEAYLFAQLVEFMDNNPGKIPEGTKYVYFNMCTFYICLKPNAYYSYKFCYWLIPSLTEACMCHNRCT